MRRTISRTVLAAVATIGASYVAMKREPFVAADRHVSSAIAVPRGRDADIVVAAATDLGSVFAVTGLSGVLLASGRWRAALDVAGAGATAWVASQAIKPLVERPRPYQAEGRDRLVSEPAGSSWPSGHPAVAAAMASSLTPHLPPTAKAVASGVAGFVALSRVYVGVHYVTDVLAGLALGSLSGRAWRVVRRASTPKTRPGTPSRR